jgi:hypothetical protein
MRSSTSRVLSRHALRRPSPTSTERAKASRAPSSSPVFARARPSWIQAIQSRGSRSTACSQKPSASAKR